MYAGLITSVRVEMTCPSFTNVGPSLTKLSRMNSAAAVEATFFSSGSKILLALTTFRAAAAPKRQTSTLRRSDEPEPRFSQPSSSTSPRVFSSSPSSTICLASTVRKMRPPRLRTARRIRVSSAQICSSSGMRLSSESTISHASPIRSSAAFSASRASRARRKGIRRSRLRSRVGFVAAAASSSLTIDGTVSVVVGGSIAAAMAAGEMAPTSRAAALASTSLRTFAT
mmetsp:Transcript_37656/g.102227  ORF Transcript_37656/g.102227 Transcript_37656/m.102227 type:complete len:227 (-) Transcript_37656:997-1677(-)